METINFAKPCWLMLYLSDDGWFSSGVAYSSLERAVESQSKHWNHYETRIVRVDSATFTEGHDARTTPDV